MADVTIVTDDAAALVAEGGVVNRDRSIGPTYEWQEPDPSVWPQGLWMRVCGGCGNGPLNDSDEWCGQCVLEVAHPLRLKGEAPTGTVRVVDVHHSDDCQPTLHDFQNAPVEVLDAPICPGEPNRWHYVCEPIGQGDGRG